MRPEDAELRKALARLADEAPTPQSLADLEAPLVMGPKRQPTLSPCVVALAAAVTLFVGGAGWWSVSRDQSDTIDVTETTVVDTADQPVRDPDPTQPTRPAEIAENPPYLIVEADGWEMTYFNNDTYQPSNRSWTPQLFRSGSALTDPTIVIGVFDTSDPDVGWGAGENAEVIELDGRTIEVTDDAILPAGHLAGVTFDDGTLVVAQGYGLSRTEFVDAVRAAEFSGESAALPTLTGFAEVNLSGPWEEQVTRREAQFNGPEGAGAEVRVWSGTQTDIELQAVDRILEATSIRQGSIDGAPVVIAQHSDVRFFIVGGSDSFVIEIDLQLGPEVSEEAVDVFLSSLRTVDRASFEAIAPDGSITTQTQDQAIAEMLTDIPIPPGFDTRELNTTGDRYQVGAHVAGSVTCEWIEQWLQAIEANDTEGTQQAVEALTTAPQWAILLEMEPNGDYSEVLWQTVDTIAAGQNENVESSYQAALGCD